MPPVDWTIFTIVPPDVEANLIRLMEHVASGAPDEWAVYLSNGTSQRFDSFQDANRYYEEAPKGLDVSLALYTRVGTSVVFRFRKATE